MWYIKRTVHPYDGTVFTSIVKRKESTMTRRPEDIYEGPFATEAAARQALYQQNGTNRR